MFTQIHTNMLTATREEFERMAGDEDTGLLYGVGIPLFETEKTMETLMMLPHIFPEWGKRRKYNSSNQKGEMKCQ